MPDTYYGPNAYNSSRIPSLPRPQGPAPALSPLTRRLSTLLPYGNTQDVAPFTFLNGCTPKFLRTREEFLKTDTDDTDYHFRFTHESYRHASFSIRTLFWGYMAGIGKILFFITIPLFIFGFIVELFDSPAGVTWQSIIKKQFLAIGWYFMGIPLLCWLLGATVIHFFSHWVDRPGKGPLWEMNRRTGMVTLFVYDKRGTYGRTGKPEEISAPFYEFDAYWVTGGDRQGPLHYLYFVHRYRNINVPIGDLISGRRNAVDCYAFWDMWQNYMDTSRPLPDIPLWEEYRDQDPVTAEHDRRTGRPPRYWRDMDDKTWEQTLMDMNKKIHAIDTLYRPDLMRPRLELTDAVMQA